MSEKFSIYCDESCHLERDGVRFMALGAVWCKTDQVKPIADRLRELKENFGLFRRDQISRGTGPVFETKWTKVSLAKVDFYLSLVNYFFDDDDLHFRTVLIDKKLIDHEKFQQTHDDWYYRMMFVLLEQLIVPPNKYRIYLDIKDTKSECKRAKLEEVLRTGRRDRSGPIIERVQQIRSHESELLQLADLLLGAVVFHNRVKCGDLAAANNRNAGKLRLVNRIRQRSHKSLEDTTWQREPKFNILKWNPRLS